MAGLAAAAALTVSGCANNPVQAGCGSAPGQTVETCALALYGEYVIFESAGAHLVADPAVPSAVKRAIQVADAAGAPIVEHGEALLEEYESAAGALAAAPTASDKLAIATLNLQSWIAQATPQLQALRAAVGAGEKP
ncbi:MAG: hypothetical protein ACRDLF_14430 [Solirubrobacteraceae bacterium]